LQEAACDAVAKVCGHKRSFQSIDARWSNMIRDYRSYKAKLDTSGEGAVTVPPWFDAMHELQSRRLAIAPASVKEAGAVKTEGVAPAAEKPPAVKKAALVAAAEAAKRAVAHDAAVVERPGERKQCKLIEASSKAMEPAVVALGEINACTKLVANHLGDLVAIMRAKYQAAAPVPFSSPTPTLAAASVAEMDDESMENMSPEEMRHMLKRLAAYAAKNAAKDGEL